MLIYKKNILFAINIFFLLIIWSTVLFFNSDINSVVNYWMYSLTMMFGAIVAGLTPLGGGMVAFPVLSLYFNIDPSAARDFSLAIQAMGMTSASVYILTRKKIPLNLLKYFPFFIFINFLGFIIGTGLYNGVDKQLVQLFFVSFSLAFICAYLHTKKDMGYETLNLKDTTIRKKMIIVGILLCFAGGIITAFFGTGTDLFLYVLFTMYLNLKEKISTDLSIIAMATMSILGFFYRYFFVGINNDIINMWLAAVPVVIFFAPFGNKILSYVRRNSFLNLILILTTFNWLYFIKNVPSSIPFSLVIIVIFFVMFISFNKDIKTNNSSRL